MVFLWTELFSLGIVCLIMFSGEVFSIKTRGRIPQMLVVTILFLIGFWTILPQSILTDSHIMTLSKIVFSIILIDVGTTLDLKEIVKNKHIILVSIASVITIIVTTLVIGMVLFNEKISLNAIPSLTGAGIGAMMMNSSALNAKELYYGAVAMTIFVCHTFISFPFATYILKKEAASQLLTLRDKPSVIAEKPALSSNKKYNYYQTPTFYLTVLFLLAALVEVISLKLHLNSAVLQIITGICARQLGLLDKNPFLKTASSGLLNIALFASFMQSFAMISFPDLMKLLVIAVPLNICTLLSLLLLAKFISSKELSWHMTVAIGMNSFLGFPFNFLLTKEAISAVTSSGEEQEQLANKMLPKMILASTFSVSLLTPIIASICIKLLY